MEVEVPFFFRCPISMEIMDDPVTISTGVTYDRTNIEKWLHDYKKRVCPATMQNLDNLDLTPNSTLKSLIQSWREQSSRSSSSSPWPSSPLRTITEGLIAELKCLLDILTSAPFKVSPLKRLKSLFETYEGLKTSFIELGGIDVLSPIILQVSDEISDFVAFTACQHALAVLHQLQLADEASLQLLFSPECFRSMTVILQRGSAEARFHTVSILRRMTTADPKWSNVFNSYQAAQLVEPLLQLLSDEIITKSSSMALDVLIEICRRQRTNQLRAVEAGAVSVLIELLPDMNRSRAEKNIHLLFRLLCGCAEGRMAFADHRMGIAVISKKVFRVSQLATQMGVKILWLICSLSPTNHVIDDMLTCGAVKKLSALLYINGHHKTKARAIKILRLHANAWRRHPCCPGDLRNSLTFMN